ncbi:MAG: replication factor C large subunit [Thermoproteota archaeon]|jgi:replication factor C large subunit|uniref:Replication factor C large subunit n=1 Tax=Candidatus Methanodesulfokora washburnensis TaxID=2478471 RepID=A0A429GFS5_9CREN|nr:replication factor C large subunit [Candidatus Methanodesulfokores washburnensis]RSN72601.1 replication factor C large subunit [Candidatus Methanodesulfokores washburnensis]RZN59432.1 MAG: replication factor C large subunit [Candidatus Methanodesulfokores washburnensis]TDA38612.1 MAG: replication factor C large subunit [Candidatus Korarchaeota archaeon]
MLPWVEKYRPKRLKDIVGQNEAIEQIMKWIEDVRAGKKVKPLLIYGPAGTGKTTAAYAIANELGYDIVEINCADLRDKEKLNRVLGGLGSFSLIEESPRIILFDEVDALPAEGKTISSLLKEILSRGDMPVVMTANDVYEKHMYGIRNLADTVEFKKLGVRDIVKVLSKIATMEKVNLPEEAIKKIASGSDGDLRSAINDLQSLAEGSADLVNYYGKIFGQRDREADIFRVLGSVFSGKYCTRTRFLTSTLDMDQDMFMRWIEENLPIAIKDPPSLSLAYEYVSLADIFRSRIVRTGNWKLMTYINEFLTLGVCSAKSLSKSSGFVKFKFPSIIKELASTKEERAELKDVLRKIAKNTHTSSNVVRREILPLIAALCKRNKDLMRKIARDIGVEEDQLESIIESIKI